MWEIDYYKSARGEDEITAYISSIADKRCRTALANSLDRLKQYGPYALAKAHLVEKIGDNLYELRLHFGKNIFRALFGVDKSRILIALIFQKKQNRIPERFKNLAKQRIKDNINI